MGLNMMNIMHFATERTVSCHPYGVHRNGGFVCRRCWGSRGWRGSRGSWGSRGFHCISSPFNIRRPYGTVSHGVTKEIRRVMKRSEIPAYNNWVMRIPAYNNWVMRIPAYNNWVMRIPAYNNRVMQIPAYNNRVMQIPAYNNRDNHAINHTKIPQNYE